MNKYEITWDEQYQLIKLYDLLDEITTATGWCIKNIYYDIQLK